MDAWESAWGVAEVVDENMANAARVHAVENGEDLSDYTMIAFGGAAPLHAGRLCEKLGIKRCLVPPGAGVGSAIGFLRAPFSFEANRTLFMQLSRFDAASRAAALRRTCRRRRPASCAPAAGAARSCRTTRSTCAMPARAGRSPSPSSPEEARAADPAVVLRPVRARIHQPLRPHREGARRRDHRLGRQRPYARGRRRPGGAADRHAARLASRATRSLFDAGLGRRVEAAPIPRGALSAGSELAGPAVITEDETTIVLPSSRVAVALNDGCIDIRLPERDAAPAAAASREPAHV